MELSNRLQAVADLVSEGMIVADVGTDHGYIPIYLIQVGKCPSAFAMDVNEGPLMRARDHIAAYNLTEKITTRLSDGVKALEVGECDSVVVAGMGGALSIRIMEEGKAIFKNLKEFVLQPQSEIEKVRQYLLENAYCVVKEDMILEDGKFYPMMKVANGKAEPYNAIELRYGKRLLEEKHPVLKVFLEKEIQKKENILACLNPEQGEHIKVRIEEMKNSLECAKEAFNIYL